MEFRLVYRGPLKPNGGREDKQAIRRVIHPHSRLRRLGAENQEPQKEVDPVLRRCPRITV